MNRRNFIDKSGRTFLLGALAIVSGVLVSRRQVVRGNTCTEDFMCRSCRKLSDCRLPEAETERNHG